jgi:hypothetical protein
MGPAFGKRTGVFAIALKAGARFPFKADDELSKTPAKPEEKPAEKPADKPASGADLGNDKPSDKPADKPADKSADKPAEKPPQKLTTKLRHLPLRRVHRQSTGQVSNSACIRCRYRLAITAA